MTNLIFSKRVCRPEMSGAALSPMAEVTDGGLTILVGLTVKYNCLGVPGTCLSTTRSEDCCVPDWPRAVVLSMTSTILRLFLTWILSIS